MLPYVSEKINKDTLIAQLDKLTLGITNLRLQFDEKLTAMESDGSIERADPQVIAQIRTLISNSHTIEHALGKSRAELVNTPTTTLEKVAETLEAGDAKVRDSCCFRVSQFLFCGRYTCCSAEAPEEAGAAAGPH
jgi:hypothetical protein